ncbi:MAG: hypothetical protein JWN20_2661 [Jatrophihabitantaceae bacterium]|nr:hypothetical protein [Jatrophihabitantaceae bacterium]
MGRLVFGQVAEALRWAAESGQVVDRPRLRQPLHIPVQAVVYDGALRGVHLEELMTRHGLVVVNKVAAAPLSDAEKAERGGIKAAESYPLGSWEHDTNDGACTHTLAAVDGAIVEVTLDDTGDPAGGGLTRRRLPAAAGPHMPELRPAVARVGDRRRRAGGAAGARPGGARRPARAV